MPDIASQPLLCVRDVQRASRWYQSVLGAQSGHGGDEYERIVHADVLLLQLHVIDAEHHHGLLMNPDLPLGNGVAVWFHVADLDAAAKRAQAVEAHVVQDIHVNPNARHRELWLRDPDGYLVVLSGA